MSRAPSRPRSITRRTGRRVVSLRWTSVRLRGGRYRLRIEGRGPARRRVTLLVTSRAGRPITFHVTVGRSGRFTLTRVVRRRPRTIRVLAVRGRR